MSDSKTTAQHNGPGIDSSAGVAAPRVPVDSTARRSISRKRLVGVDALIAFTTLLAVIGIFSIWVNRLLFNPDQWQQTSTQLLANPDIRDATSNYIVDQLYANVNVTALLRSGLPPQLQALAGPASGALRNAAVKGVDLALTRPRVQSLWATANRAADQTFIAIVEGGRGPVGVQQGAVTLDLASIVNNVAARLGLPSDIGAKLPPTIAHMTVFRSDQLKLVQNAGNAIKDLALWLTILVPLMYFAAIGLAAGHRRRTLMTAGFAIVFAGIVAFLGRSILQTQIVNSIVQDETVRPAASATIAIGTSMIKEIAGAFIAVGLVVVAAAWFAGPARIARAGRRLLAPYLREHAGACFAATGAVMVLIFMWNPIPATGKPAGMIVFLALALVGTEVLRRQTLREFPDVRAGEEVAAIRARVQSHRQNRHQNGAPASSTGSTLSSELERLVALRDKGAISETEYDTAKANLLRA